MPAGRGATGSVSPGRSARAGVATTRSARRTMAVLIAVAVTATLMPWRSAPPARAHVEGCARLGDAQLSAQLLGAPLHEPTAGPAVQTMVAEHVGTVVLLGGAITSGPQVSALIAELDGSAPAGLPPLVSVDEEGGRVARFGRAGVTVHLQSPRTQAAQWTAAEVQHQAAGLAAELAALGVDHNLAPVLDLSGDAADAIIGDRSFSVDPAVAGEYGAAFAAGMGEAGIRTSAKHFPDHGMTTVDTHRDVAVVDVSLDALRDVHLQPYRRALDHIDSIMLSHLRIPALDPHLPVSVSPAAVTFLRGELPGPGGGPYDGVVVTDDLSMQAVAAVADEPTAVVMAIAAGVDLALVGSHGAAADAHARLVQAVRDGVVSRARLRQAAERVLLLKGLPPAQVTCLVGPTHYLRPVR